MSTTHRRLQSRRWLAAGAVLTVILAGCSEGASDVPAVAPSDEPTSHERDVTSVDPSPSVTTEPTAPSSTASPQRPSSPSESPSVSPRDTATPTSSPSATPTSEPDPEPEPELQADPEEGEPVELLQATLQDMGFDPGPVDGIPGQRTTAAVAAFQHHAGLDVTGVVDAATVEALGDDRLAVVAIGAGDEGADVEDLQRRLAEAPLDPGPADGVYGTKTAQAIYTLEKLAGMPVNGVFDGVDDYALDQLLAGELDSAAARERHSRRWVEVDLSRQLMAVYDPGDPSTPILASHASSGNGERWCNDTAGCRIAVTPTGHFAISRRIDGWRESSLDIGRLYNPLYFRGGIALHGALSVPLYPASHGCVRLPMHVAEYLPGMLPNGTPVDVLA